MKYSIALLFLFVLFSFSTPLVFATGNENDEDLIGEDGMDMKIDKAQISQMVELMKAQGQISAEDAAKAQKDLSQKSDADMQKLQAEAEARVKSGDIPKLPPPTTPANDRAPAAVSAAPATAPVAAPVTAPAAEPAKTGAKATPAAADERSKNLKDAFKFINEK